MNRDDVRWNACEINTLFSTSSDIIETKNKIDWKDGVRVSIRLCEKERERGTERKRERWEGETDRWRGTLKKRSYWNVFMEISGWWHVLGIWKTPWFFFFQSDVGIAARERSAASIRYAKISGPRFLWAFATRTINTQTKLMEMWRCAPLRARRCNFPLLFAPLIFRNLV